MTRRKNKKSTNSVIWLALIFGAVIIFAKVIFILLPFAAIGGGAYYYSKWQNEKLTKYNNDWKSFYENEIKRTLKIAVIVAPISIGIGYIVYSNYEKIEKERTERLEVAAKQKIIEEEKLRLALQVKKDSSQYYFELALKDFNKRRYSKSLVNLDSSIMIYPENYDALLKKGIALRENGKYDEAITVFNDLKSKTSEYESEIYLEKGKCFIKLKNKEEAIFQLSNTSTKRNFVSQLISQFQ